MFYKIKQSHFVRNVAVLSSGSLVAQLLTIGAAPILTRLYAPEAFSVLAIFVALVTTAGSVASGRYDIAIPVAKSDSDANGLIVLSFWISLVISLIILILVCIGADQLSLFLNTKKLNEWLFIVPLAIFMLATATTLQYNANRNKIYKKISIIIIIQAFVNVIFSIFFILLGFQDGMLMAILLSFFSGVISLFFINFKYINKEKLIPNLTTWLLAKKYKQFPLYEASASFLNALQISLPIFFLAKYYSAEAVAYYALISKVAMSPLAFISSSVSQVHLRKVAELVQLKIDCKTYLIQLILALTVIVAIPTIILMIFAPPLFGWLFGENWLNAGHLLTILMPAFAIRFIASTISTSIISTGNTHLAAYWKIFALLTTFGVFTLFFGKLNLEDIFKVMAYTDSFLYSIYIYITWHSIKNPKEII